MTGGRVFTGGRCRRRKNTYRRNVATTEPYSCRSVRFLPEGPAGPPIRRREWTPTHRRWSRPPNHLAGMQGPPYSKLPSHCRRFSPWPVSWISSRRLRRGRGVSRRDTRGFAPSKCELQYGTTPSVLFGESPRPRSPRMVW